MRESWIQFTEWPLDLNVSDIGHFFEQMMIDLTLLQAAAQTIVGSLFTENETGMQLLNKKCPGSG